MSYKHECLVTVIKPENVASSNNIQHIFKIVIFNKFSLGVRVYEQSICLCLSNNYECVQNPTFHIIKRKMCKFKICSIICHNFLIFVLLMQVFYHVLCKRMKVW